MGIVSESIAAARVMFSMYFPAVERAPTVVAREGFGDITQQAFTGRKRTIVQCGVFYGPNVGALIISAGVGGPANSQNLAIGYANTAQMREQQQANSTSYADAREVFEQFFQGLPLPRRRVRLFGHSAGGTMCEILARMIHDRAGISPESIVTYGSPKPGFRGACTEAPATTRRRWMNVGDPVPFVPTGNIGDAMAITLALTQFEPEPWNCVHGSGGRVLDGRTQRPRNDAQVMGGAAAQIEEWINRNPDRITDHSIAQYIRNLSAIAEEPGEDETVTPGAGASVTIALDRVADQAIVPAPERRLTMVAPRPLPPIPIGLPLFPVITTSGGKVTYTNGLSIPAVVNQETAMAQSKIVTRMKFRVKKLKPGFAVDFQGFRCVTADKLTKAKTFAKAGNRWLRVMGNDVTINTPNLVTALGTFLALAAIPGNGVNPPIVVI